MVHKLIKIIKQNIKLTKLNIVILKSIKYGSMCKKEWITMI